MQISAEIRWFWSATLPIGFEDWFRKLSQHVPGGGEVRMDEYLHDLGQAELGVKRRGGKKGVEVKGLVNAAGCNLTVWPFVGPLEIWGKWTSEALVVEASTAIQISKRRWLRKFNTNGSGPVEVPLNNLEQPLDATQPRPDRGCNVELTQVTVGNEIWWTFGFEAFGGVATIVDDFHKVVRLLTKSPPSDFGKAILASYPAWLKDYAIQK